MKYKRKLTPATTFDFAAMETWLSDMAEDGWIPVDFRGGKVKFRQDEPQKRIFRIAIPDFYNDTPSAKQIEAYRQLGWEYLAARATFWQTSRSTRRSLILTPKCRRKILTRFIARSDISTLSA